MTGKYLRIQNLPKFLEGLKIKFKIFIGTKNIFNHFIYKMDIGFI
jgi:hypothetical protein